MTAGFTAPRLAGIKTLPANAAHIDDLVAEIEKDTKPGDRVLVFPDGQTYYVLSGRTNPTRVDWYDPIGITPAISQQAVVDLENDPPTWIIVQDYQESDFQHLRPNDFANQSTWKPIYDYIQAAFTLVRTIDDAHVYHLKESPFSAASPTAPPQAVPGESCPTSFCYPCLLYTSPSPRDQRGSRMPSSA